MKKFKTIAFAILACLGLVALTGCDVLGGSAGGGYGGGSYGGSDAFMDSYLEAISGVLPNLDFSGRAATTIFSVVIGLMAAACIILRTIFTKKKLGFGIVCAILCFFGIIGGQLFANHLAIALHGLLSSSVEITSLIGSLIAYLLGMIMMMLGWLFSIIFIIKQMKDEPKIFGILALVLALVKYLVIPPFNTFGILGGPQTQDDFIGYSVFGLIVNLIPYILLLVGGILNMVKAKNAPAVEVAPAFEEEAVSVEEATAEEAPAEEAIAEEAPADEAEAE